MSKETDVMHDVVNNLRRIFQVLVEQSRIAEEETGLTGPQLWAMKEISAAGSLNGVELARRMFVHPATIVNLLDRLEERGLVVRVRSKRDRRVVDIELTEVGAGLVKNSPEVAQDVLVKGLGALKNEDVGKISDGLQQLVEVLGVDKKPPRMILSQGTEAIISSMKRRN